MSYIIKKNDPMVNLKLTNKGRRNLSSGGLSFINFGLGDGEMDYTSDNPQNVNVLRPTDNQHDINYPVPSDGSNFRLPINIITSVPTVIHTPAKTRGFFSTVSGSTTGSTVSNSLCLVSAVTGHTASANTLTLKRISNSHTNTSFKHTINTGDYLFLVITPTGYTSNYGAVPLNNIPNNAVQCQMYSIQTINSAGSYNISGYTTGTTITVKVDRNLPAYGSGKYTYTGYIYPGVNTISDFYDTDTPIAYWSGGLLDFTSTCTLSNNDVPVWNMNIITMEDVIGLDSTIYRGKYDHTGKTYWGTAINYDYFLNLRKPKIGVIHYTNNTVGNFYGEGFYQNNFKLFVPYLMWHKEQFGGISQGTSMGYTFTCGSDLKVMGANNTVVYYDLVDGENTQTVVGKVLVDEKIVIIEDQELITALALKGNRNWTLPTPKLTMVNPGTCYESSLLGAIQSDESLHISYAFLDTSGTTGMHCENYTTVTNTGTTPQDVVFEFPKDPTDPTYSELSYLKDYTTYKGIGYRTNSIMLLWQKTPSNALPLPNNWSHWNINNYLGTSGCLTSGSFVTGHEEFDLHLESALYTTGSSSFTGTTISATNYHQYALTQKQIGDILIASGSTFSGKILTPASSIANIGVDGDYYLYPTSVLTTSDGRSIVLFKDSMLHSGSSFFQFGYLIGSASTSATLRENVTVPSVLSGNTYLNGIYLVGSSVAITLHGTPSNNVVWVFYNGQLLSSNNYGVYTTGTTANRRVQLGFTPTTGSNITVFYLDSSALGTNPVSTAISLNNIANLRVNIDKSFLDLSENYIYNLNDYISLPAVTSTGFTYGDEVFFFGVVSTDIKATIYKTLLTCNVLPNKFINTSNPTFDPNGDKVAFTEIGIYDDNNDMIACGKFSQPLTRKYNSDMLIIQATMDF